MWNIDVLLSGAWSGRERTRWVLIIIYQHVEAQRVVETILAVKRKNVLTCCSIRSHCPTERCARVLAPLWAREDLRECLCLVVSLCANVFCTR